MRKSGVCCSLRANMLVCQRGLCASNFTCQRAIWRANVSTWRAKGANFETFLLRNSKRNFYTLLYKKCYIIRDIIVIHIMCICIAHKNCIIFHVWIFFFFICSLVRNENIRFSRVSSNFPQLKQLIKIKNTCEYYDLFELWCAWVGDST